MPAGEVWWGAVGLGSGKMVGKFSRGGQLKLPNRSGVKGELKIIRVGQFEIAVLHVAHATVVVAGGWRGFLRIAAARIGHRARTGQ